MAIQTRKVMAADSAYLDPLNADSIISYKVIGRSTRTSGSVQLTDCSDKIEWYFNDKNVSIKINKAIEMLTAFRDAYNAAEKARKLGRKAKSATASK